MNNLIKRAVFGGLFVVVFIACLWWGKLSSIFFFALVGGIALAEIILMLYPNKLNRLIIHFMFVPITMSLILNLRSYLNNQVSLGAFISLSLFLFLLLIVQLFSSRKIIFMGRVSEALLATTYSLFPFILLVLFCLRYEPILLIGISIIIWANDTFAYLVGRKIGKSKLFPRISPNKTWEGTIGGLICALAIALFIHPVFFDDLSRIDWFFVGLIAIIFGSIGDLIESMFKRYYGIKDSGNIIPGHGGVLDRFDALMGAIPFVFAYLFFV